MSWYVSGGWGGGSAIRFFFISSWTTCYLPITALLLFLCFPPRLQLLRMKESALFSQPRLLKSLTEVKQSIAMEVAHRKEADEASQAVCFSTLHRIEKEALAAFGPPIEMIEEPAASSKAALSASASAAPAPSVAEEAAVVVAAMVDTKAASKKAAPTNTPAVAAAKPPAAAAPKKK